MEIKGLKAVVTGAGSGMGRYFVLSLLKSGASVAACDLSEESLFSLKEEAKSYEGDLLSSVLDVSDEDSVVSFMSMASDKLSGISVLINNAGITRDGLLIKKKEQGFKTMTLDNWNQVIGVNLTGPFLFTREFARNYIDKDQKRGVVINISSVSHHGNIGQSNYSASKAGLVADTVVWAKELSRYGIRVGAIAPGFINTPILKSMRPEMLEKMLKPVPLGRLGEPEEIWQGVKFIIECDYFTGRLLEIDGGIRL